MDSPLPVIDALLKALQDVDDAMHAFYLHLHTRPEISAIAYHPIHAKIANYSGVSATLRSGLIVDFWFELVWYGEFWQLDYYISKSNRDEDGCHMIREPVERKME